MERKHNGHKHTLVKPIVNRPEIPTGFEVAWNVYENGYTGEKRYWFSINEIEQSENWHPVINAIPLEKNGTGGLP